MSKLALGGESSRMKAFRRFYSKYRAPLFLFFSSTNDVDCSNIWGLKANFSYIETFFYLFRFSEVLSPMSNHRSGSCSWVSTNLAFGTRSLMVAARTCGSNVSASFQTVTSDFRCCTMNLVIFRSAPGGPSTRHCRRTSEPATKARMLSSVACSTR